MTQRDRKSFWAVVGALPLLLALLVDEVPRFVCASCTYYTSCNQATFAVTAQPAAIALNEASALEATNAACPCAWQIQSQPGGWQVLTLSDCKATLKPSGTYGNPGTITVLCTSPPYCSKTVTVTAGVSTFRVQASTSGGSAWVSDTLSLQGKPGQTVDFAVRVTLTVTDDVLEGWSYGVAQGFGAITQAGGALAVLSGPQTAGTHTATVQAGSLPDFQESELRQPGGATLGFTQGVVIDYDAAVDQDPVLNFVTLGLCYRLTLPAAGTYQGTFSFSGDLGDGRPPIACLVVQQGEGHAPTLRSLVVKVTTSPYLSLTPGSCATTWITSGDGIAGPPPPQGGGAGGGGGTTVPPVSLGDTDDNGQVELTDAVRVLRFLFQGGDEPARVNTTGLPNVLRTGQVTCFDRIVIVNPPTDMDSEVPCATILPAHALFGQDGHYVPTGIGLERMYVVPDLNGNGQEDEDVVTDLRTGLMWQRRPNEINRNALGGTSFALSEATAAAEALVLEGFSDWRLPTIGELISVLDYGRPHRPLYNGVAVPEVFNWGAAWGDGIWTSSDYRLEFNSEQQWTVNPFNLDLDTRHTIDTDDELCFVAVRSFPQTPLTHLGPEAPPNLLLHLGDADAIGGLAINDAILILNFLFRGGPPPHVVTRPLQEETFLAGRFTNNGDGTVSDTVTRLMWHRMPIQHGQSEGIVDWYTALGRAEDNPLLNMKWRLPNVFELGTLSNFAASSTAVPGMPPEFVAFSNNDCTVPFPPTGCNLPYWSSTTAPEISAACHFLPNSAFSSTVVGAGSLRSGLDMLGDKRSFVGWVQPVLGPVETP
jgi:hypothetical protein